jgi:hypothetical protein
MTLPHTSQRLNSSPAPPLQVNPNINPGDVTFTCWDSTVALEAGQSEVEINFADNYDFTATTGRVVVSRE